MIMAVRKEWLYTKVTKEKSKRQKGSKLWKFHHFSTELFIIIR